LTTEGELGVRAAGLVLALITDDETSRLTSLIVVGVALLAAAVVLIDRR
jgi:hypothetical protein